MTIMSYRDLILERLTVRIEKEHAFHEMIVASKYSFFFFLLVTIIV